MKSDCEEKREQACETLAKIPGAAAPYAAALAARLEDSRYPVRRAACAALAALEPPLLSQHAGALLRRLGDRTDLVRWMAVDALARLPGPELEALVPGLAGRAVDAEARVRWAAVELLGRLPPESLAAHTHVLIARFGDQDERVRGAAIQIFRRLKSDVMSQHIVAACPLFEDEDETVRNAALQLILDLDQTALLELVENGDGRVRCAALRAIAVADPQRRSACATAAAERLADTMPEVQLEALGALERLDSETFANYSSEVAFLLSSLDDDVKSKAVGVLANHPGVLATYVDSRARLLQESNAEVSQAAEDACAQLEPPDFQDLQGGHAAHPPRDLGQEELGRRHHGGSSVRAAVHRAGHRFWSHADGLRRPVRLPLRLQKHWWFKSAENEGRASTALPATGLPVLLGNVRKESAEAEKDDKVVGGDGDKFTADDCFSAPV